MYVRTDGDDANDGLTPDAAKATIEAAIEDAPLHLDGGEPLVIDIGSGTFGRATLTHLSATSSVKLSGATDGNGDPATTLDAADNGNTIDADGVYALSENLTLQNGSYVNGRASHAGSLELSNCHLAGGDPTEFNARAVASSFVRVRPTLTADWSAGDASASAHVESSASHARVDGTTLTTEGNQGVVVGKQSAYVEVYNAVLDAGGGKDCLVLCDGSNCKMGGDTVEFRNASNGVVVDRGSDAMDKTNNGVTFANISVEPWKARENSSFDANTESTWAMPLNPSDTDVTDTFGEITPHFHYNTTEDHPKAFDPANNDWLLVGLRELTSGEVSVPAGGEKDAALGVGGESNLLVTHGPSTTENGRLDYSIFHSGGSDTFIRFEELGGGNPATHHYTVYEMPIP
ncbi:hypothetical protein PM033_10620 [Halorubrum ezzemoulense]|uniref:hypothetical protein n=1 Tax=Halorubrum ezzemoulense TaxID=337243 RepID=UPI00233099B6|nr:hypothetical protein [Halorubrum ezzemoulense]MDB2252226.1 hypothetical protein [Halorubrum ezzemoulense]